MTTRIISAGIFFIIQLLPGCYSKNELPATGCSANLTEGYTDKVSYYPGEIMKVYLHASRPLGICRLTVFNVNGDSIFSVGSPLPHHAKYPWKTGSTQGFNYPVTSQFTIPEIQSGVYLIERKIPFVVKTKKKADVTIVYPSNTANAYSYSGGKNLYSPGVTQVSFQRPIELQPYSKICLEWLERQTEFSVGYVADADLDTYDNFSQSHILAVIGHSEYWTRRARMNFDRFVDSGKHALILSGNTMWWQIRYSDDQTKMICYRDAASDSVADRSLATTDWINPVLDYPLINSIGAIFTYGGYGRSEDEGWDGYKIICEDSPLLEGTQLKNGDTLSLPTLEYDGTLVKEFNSSGYPVMDYHKAGFFRGEIIGFDRGFRSGPTTPTFIVFQKTKASGIIVNAASTEWCGSAGMGGRSGSAIKKITLNAIRKLLRNETVFSQTSNSPRP